MTNRIACRAVFLDAGGVIVLPDRHLLAGALARVGIDIDPSAVPVAHYRAVRALDHAVRVLDRAPGRSDYPGALFPQLGIVPGRTAEALAAWEHLAARSRSGVVLWSEPTPGAPHTISALQRARLAVVIVTNSDGHGAENLAASGFAGVPVIDSHVVGAAKPDVAHLRSRPRLRRRGACRAGPVPRRGQAVRGRARRRHAVDRRRRRSRRGDRPDPLRPAPSLPRHRPPPRQVPIRSLASHRGRLIARYARPRPHGGWITPHSTPSSARVSRKPRYTGPCGALGRRRSPSEGLTALNSGASDRGRKHPGRGARRRPAPRPPAPRRLDPADTIRRRATPKRSRARRNRRALDQNSVCLSQRITSSPTCRACHRRRRRDHPSRAPRRRSPRS